MKISALQLLHSLNVNVLNHRKRTLLLTKKLFVLLNKAWKRAYKVRRLNSRCLRSLAIAWPSSANWIDRMILPAWLHKFLEETTLLSHSLGVFSSITHPEASSTQPPPSSAPVWVVEQTPPLRQQCPGSTDPKPRRSPQTPLHLSSLPEMKGVFIVVKPPKYDCGEMIPHHWHFFYFNFVISFSINTYHFPSVSDHVCYWQDVCVLSSSTHPECSQLHPAAGISDAGPSLQTGSRFFKFGSVFSLTNHCTVHTNGRAKDGKRNHSADCNLHVTVPHRNVDNHLTKRL